MKEKIDIDAICRVNGMAPSTRQRWYAFWRLWRLTRANDPRNHAEESFKILMHDWRWITLATKPGDYLSFNRFLPKSVRKFKVGMIEHLEL